MATPDEAVEVGSDFDPAHVQLGEGNDILAVAGEFAKQAGVEQDESADAKAKREADEKAKADADAKAKADADAKAKADADAKAKADEEARAAAPGGNKDKVGGILAKDGKNVIPYAVLETAREKEAAERKAREDAEAEARGLRQQLDDLLKQASDGGKKSAGKPGVISDDLMTRIEKVKESVPEVGEPLEALVQEILTLHGQVADIRENTARSQAEEQAAAKSEVQEAIDRNPALRFLQAENRDLWAEAVRIDKMLRESPRNKDLSFDDRFTKVVTLLEADQGKIEIPEKYLPKETAEQKAARDAEVKAKADAEAKAGLSDTDAKARAEAELKKAADKKQAITLSDLPGGMSPETDDRTAAQISPDEVAQRVEAFLEKGGSISEIPGLFTTG